MCLCLSVQGNIVMKYIYNTKTTLYVYSHARDGILNIHKVCAFAGKYIIKVRQDTKKNEWNKKY